MSKSSRNRRARAKARKRHAEYVAKTGDTRPMDAPLPTMTAADKRYMIAFGIISFVITVGYFWLGGRNLFVFPAVFCISVGARKYWAGPVRRFAQEG